MAAPKRRNISQRSEMIYDVHEFGISLDTRELFIEPQDGDGEIGPVTANRFIKNLRILTSLGEENILIHMCAPGGDWNYGIAIYDAINECNKNKAEITVLCHAHSRSMSSIIPQAAKWRVIMPTADFLIHNGTLEYDGNYTSAVREADWAKKQIEIMIDIYVNRCCEGAFWKRENMDKKAIKEWITKELDIRQEFYMTPREAVDKGFMDAVLGDDEFENIESLKS